MKRFFLFVQFVLIFCLGSNAADRPNVLFILADDLGWRDLSVEGSTFYESPNIDRIANEGVRFTNGYATCQVCSPSRASIMTGKYPARIDITEWIGARMGEEWKRNTPMLPAIYNHQLDHNETTLGEAFRNAGYRTFFAGKWHLGGEGSHPDDHGFRIQRGGSPQRLSSGRILFSLLQSPHGQWTTGRIPALPLGRGNPKVYRGPQR